MTKSSSDLMVKGSLSVLRGSE